ncbi:PTS system, mannose-specific IIB component [Lactobacillus apis]|uniref:PTS sugar transporter subunit IIB n=1 Tax=Lactobacillus apis TaxID=303541 RepID=UPI0008157007|nr:PTS sugar transporter subunit IIB [Lactobacillus apis]AWM73245.1 PTS mannose/fructose/sorbose transporter subunit IIB [Lactobacillus apis]GGG41777.1 PTS mannose transporter subunit IIA [Lactobacillus apis]SCC05419.1 PTS system, mannose-specific IIB component [Lactobacillus apis]
MIKMVRVDYRLLHGQVAFSWTQALGADALLLVSDTVKNDPLRMKALRLAKPAGTKVVIKTSDEAIQQIKSGVTDKYKLFIICETLPIASKLVKEIGEKAINLGNMPFAEDKEQVTKSIFLNKEDKELIKELADQGVDLFIQMVPSENKIDAKKFI